ncbi:MAG: baseplate J/gp47 family protein, partial [Gammaproteobacteria bacterium]|nr:baseplate J/gp47 family protein [Gammaproteobacteria bacterium]
MSYGVTDEGFVIKPFAVIEQEIKDSQLANINPALDQTAQGPIGQLNGINSAKLREIWELVEAAYNAFNPDSASAASLDNVVALCPGIIRDAATKSAVECTCNLDNGTYAIGELVAHVVGNPEARFVNTEAVTVAAGPSDEDLDFEAEETGEVVALSGTLTVIAEPVTGWNSVTNASDADVGSPIETDTELRTRREETIRFSGSATVEAIKADVLDIDEVETAIVEENEDDEVQNGLLPHSVHVVIWDGSVPAADDAEVATA